MKTRRASFLFLLVLALPLALAACNLVPKETPTEPAPVVPFGAPVAVWSTGRGELFVYTDDNRSWSDTTEADFQRSFDDLVFRLRRVVGAEVFDQLRCDGLNLVLQDPRKPAKWDKGQRALFVSSSADLTVALLELWCAETKDKNVCDLRR